MTTIGGSFGGKQAKDALRQALYLSEKLYKPIQLMWTREHEMQNSYPMQMSQHRVQIGLDEKNIQNFGTIELLLATQLLTETNFSDVG